MNKRKCFVLLSAALASISIPISSYGAWAQKGNYWLYEENRTFERNAWKLIDGAWYYFDDAGYMAIGWQLIEGGWYFLNTVSNGSKGKMLTGWQWIDGRCYYLADRSGNNYLEGVMYINERTPDGFFVDASGAWIDENRIVQYVAGKGIQATVSEKVVSTGKSSGRGSGGKGSSYGLGNGSNNPEIDKQEPEVKTEIPTEEEFAEEEFVKEEFTEEEFVEEEFVEEESTEEESTEEESTEEDKKLDREERQYRYMIQFMDIKDKTILRTVTGVETEGKTIAIVKPVINGYTLCKGQEESFKLTNDSMILNIYYEKESLASPSEARKVDWNLYFVERGNHSNEIFRPQKGVTEEGRTLVIDFPETILGADRCYFYSLVSSPWSLIVNGNGIQKYFIEFEKGEYLPEEDDPDQEARDRLERWLEIARNEDVKLSGHEHSDQQIITENMEESNERLLNLISMAGGSERKEVYLIAKRHVPNTVIVNQTFQNVKNISELIMDEFTIAYEKYTVLRIGFEKAYWESACSHDYQIIDKVNATCTENGHETIKCQKCGKEENVILPAAGHVDTDHDGTCDICYKTVREEPVAIHYRIGDVQARTMGNKVYLFRCIDEDYEEAIGNNQRTALFLCDSIIRSDIDGTSKKLMFGLNNNYKYSNVREWLLDQAVDDFVHESYIGITRSYIGITGRGTYEQLNDNSLVTGKEMFQLLQDKVFILSVDEGLKYRNFLWKFNGSKVNNPESQVSAYSRGYYLRTPQDGGVDDFWYGDGIYAVSLADGNIQPVSVNETSIGIRPAMAIPQG